MKCNEKTEIKPCCKGGCDLPAGGVRVDAVVRYGYNGGYVGPVVHHGSNALDYNLSVTFRATGRLTVELFTNYSQALTVVKQKGLGDDFYYGVNLKYTF